VEIFITSFLTVFLAELGDKTQLVSLTLASRYPPRHVFLGAMSGLFLVLALAVAAGEIVANLIPPATLSLVSGIFFIFIGILNYFQQEECGEVCSTGCSAFLQSFGLIFLAELGDKTQLTAMLLSATYRAPLLVLVGAMCAQALNHGFAVFVGKRYLSRLPRRYLKLSAAVLFVVIGFFIIMSSFLFC
jgi:putative Ca2+/H+ antiporter (TMEM165/GDT1 family)